MLLSADRTAAVHQGEASEKLIRNLGLKRQLQSGGEPAGYLVYYDPEVAVYSKLRIGIPSSVSFLLAASVFLFCPSPSWSLTGYPDGLRLLSGS
ncbi:hypothetical protein [Paenibacillus oceani]|uniref:hypothetical protein n=1 Tax=Paenibacillus oceani TaxID=2772510 RepID=UPI001CC22F09|nr:hypothetical protein [Paenibacillus oceani]